MSSWISLKLSRNDRLEILSRFGGGLSAEAFGFFVTPCKLPLTRTNIGFGDSFLIQQVAIIKSGNRS